MEGPTPVSALIHAATMVTAGVYLLCRMNHVLALSHTGTLVIAIIGGVTAFVAATIACAQQDIKKVLAFSTVSQIGYMILAVGSGAYIAAIFLMVAHAFFKGLLFLGAGSVIHGLDDEQDLKRMGALRKTMKWTTVTFTIGWLAIAGIPPLAGFWSKGDVLDNVFAHYKPLWALGLLTAVLTAYYMIAPGGAGLRRRVPLGQGRSARRPGPTRPHESPWIMRLPLVVLAVLSFFGGLSTCRGSTTTPSRAGWRRSSSAASTTTITSHTTSQWALALTDTAAAIIGLIIGYGLWTGYPGRQAATRAAVPPAGLVLGRLLRRRHRPPEPEAGARSSPGCSTPASIDGAVNGTANLVRSTGLGHPQAPDAATCATTRWASPWAWPPSSSSCSAGRGGHEPGFPFLTVLIMLPAVGGTALALLRPGPAVLQGVRRLVAIGCRWRTSGRGRRCPRRHEGARRRLPADLEPHLHRGHARDPLVPRASTGSRSSSSC